MTNEIAQLVKRVVMREYSLSELEISRTKSDDTIYHINSDKSYYIKFQSKVQIENAIVELCNAFKDNLLPNSFDDDFYYNVKRLKRIQAE